MSTTRQDAGTEGFDYGAIPEPDAFVLNVPEAALASGATHGKLGESRGCGATDQSATSPGWPGGPDRPNSEPGAGDVVREWLAARQDGNFDRLASLTAMHAIWHSPVEGVQTGRSAVVNEVRRGFVNSDTFVSHVLHVECHDVASVTARIRNIATRQGRHLDSVQTLFIQVERDAVSAVRIEVDDLAAVEAFWS
jgi:hypothetical protein